ncbi:MAG: hypothetical protein WCO91_02665 [Gemmataceae bacterium]
MNDALGSGGVNALAYAVIADIQGDAATDLPKGMPVGGSVVATVEVTGYFFKVYGYRAQDGLRAAPMLLAKTLDRLRGYLTLADFGTCAQDWPLIKEWDQELAEGRLPARAR